MAVQANGQSEVLIIGAGLAGIVAAIELMENGKQVLLIDRDGPDKLGGLAKESFGGVTMIGTPHQRRMGIKDRPEIAWEDWQRTAQFTSRDCWPMAWAKHYVENSRTHIFDWLAQRGIAFFPVVHWVERGYFRPGNSLPRFHMVWGTGHGLIEGLVKYLNAHPNRNKVTIQFHQHVKELNFEAGKINGCHGVSTDTGRSFSLRSEQVVVAAGGICGDLNLVKKNWHAPWGEPPEVLLNGSHRYADGQLHEALGTHGAQVTHLDHQWNYAAGIHHPHPNKELHGLSLVPPKGALWLNYQGERIGPTPLITGFDNRFLVESICRQKKKYSWQVLNYKIAMKELAVSGSEYNDGIRDKKIFQFLKSILLGNKFLIHDLMENCVDFVVADNLQDLVKKMNRVQGDQAVEYATVKKEINQWDDMIDRGPTYHNDDQLRRIAHFRSYRGDRLRTAKFQKILDPKAGPLLAIREFILSRKSLGGVMTNLNSEVLDGQAKVIPGVYAIGETAGFGGGGIHGQGTLEGTFLGACVLTALAATRTILKGKNK